MSAVVRARHVKLEAERAAAEAARQERWRKESLTRVPTVEPVSAAHVFALFGRLVQFAVTVFLLYIPVHFVVKYW